MHLSVMKTTLICIFHKEHKKLKTLMGIFIYNAVIFPNEKDYNDNSQIIFWVS